MRLTAAELERFAADIRAKCDANGLWIESLSSGRGGAYPVLLLRRGTSHAAQELSDKKRKTNAVVYTASHIVLIHNGRRPPPMLGMQASHLCHTSHCLCAESISSGKVATRTSSATDASENTSACANKRLPAFRSSTSGS
jgi:hypothetical protein